MDSPLTDSARALQILSRPGSVAVAGPKPFLQRVTLANLFKAARNASYAVGLLSASALVLTMTGVAQDFVASQQSIASIASAPVNVHWVDLPSSPFLEAGRTQDGSLSTWKMLQAWEKAGLLAGEVETVRQALPALMPTLMGREDAHLEVELIMDAKMASQRLERAFPQVAQRLRDGTQAVLTEDQAADWASERLDLEQQFYSTHTVDEMTLGDALAQSVPGAGHLIVGASQVADFPLIQAGLNADGTLNPEKLATAWQGAGIELGDALMLQEQLVKALPHMANVSFQDKINSLQDVHQVRDSVQEEFELPIARLVTGQTISLSPQAQAEWSTYRGEFLEAVQASPPSGNPTPTMAQAKKALEASIQVTGLRSVSLPVENWTSPEELMRNAERLTRANAELQKVTGWKGQVLGLNGRIELTLGKPMTVGHAEGVAFGDASGRLQVTANWNSLGHEWFHAYDYTVGRLGIQHTDGDPLSDNLEPLRKRKDATLFEAMRMAERGVREQAPQWQEHREEANDKDKTGYWLRPAEGMAYAFAAHLKLQNVRALEDGNAYINNTLTPARAPDAQETEQQAAVFQTLFAKTAYLQLSSGSVPPEPTLNQWRQGRQGETQNPLAAKREATLR